MPQACNTGKNNPRLLKAQAKAQAERSTAEKAAAASAAAASAFSEAEDKVPAAEKKPGSSKPSGSKRKQFKGRRAKGGAVAVSRPEAAEKAAPSEEPADPASDAPADSEKDRPARKRKKLRTATPTGKRAAGSEKGGGSDASAAGSRDSSEAGSERTAETGPKSKRKSVSEAKPKSKKLLAVVASIAVVVVLIGSAAGAFAAVRWFAVDDAADFAGTWYIDGTDTPVVITEDAIQINDEVGYAYTLDTDAKTLAFTFGDMSGSGTYRFSLDRGELSVADGSYTWWDTLSRDIGWYASAFVSMVAGTEASPSLGDESTTLSRIPASLRALSEGASASGDATDSADPAAEGADTPVAGGADGAADADPAAGDSSAPESPAA